MGWDHFDQTPKAVRREPIQLRRGGTFTRAMRTTSVIMLALSAILMGLFFWLALPPSRAHGRDAGQWLATDADVAKWFRELKQPDNTFQSCCGVADAYYADSFEVTGDQYVAIITDERDDAPLGRPHIDVGTRIVVPNHKLKYDAGNPTGHGVIFIGTSWNVFCYIVPGGV